MAKTSVTTSLLDARIQFDNMINEELSEKFGTICGVYIADGRPVYIIRFDTTGRLTEATSTFFRVI